MKRVALSFSLGLAAAACSPVSVPSRAPIIPTATIAPLAIASVPAAPAPPLLSPEEALQVATTLVTSAKLEAYLIQDDDIVRAKSLGLDAEKTRQLIESIERDCLGSHEREAAHCAGLSATGDSEHDELVLTLIAYLGEVADPIPLGSPTERLLVRLEARGVWRASMAIERILTRRMQATLGHCIAPSNSEIDEAKASLHDFVMIEGAPAVVSKTSSKIAKNAGPELFARIPNADELGDLAYFYASIGESGAAVGQSLEDRSHRAMTPADPALETRKALNEAMQLALYDGKLEEHAKLADRYLSSLGYPGPIHVQEESDIRWGGAEFSYVMRDAAQTAEILGRNDVAAELYRRAAPGGGACGTSTSSIRKDQLAGLVRTTEQLTGCRAALAERLNAGTEENVGTERLAKAGFDVERLYRGALLTSNRGSAVDIERALNPTPALLAQGRDRLARVGVETWAERVDATVGYADVAHKKAIDRLFALAGGGLENDRVQAITAIGDVVENIGYEPCEVPMRHGWGHGGSGPREALSVMHECEGSLNDGEMKSVVARLGALATTPVPAVRTAVAVALGKTAHVSAKPFLVKLKSDTFDEGGQVCQQNGNGREVCETNRPVRLAAINGLEELAHAAQNRAEDRAEQAKERAEQAKDRAPHGDKLVTH